MPLPEEVSLAKKVVTTNSEKSAEVIVLAKARKDRTTGGINL